MGSELCIRDSTLFNSDPPKIEFPFTFLPARKASSKGTRFQRTLTRFFVCRRHKLQRERSIKPKEYRANLPTARERVVCRLERNLWTRKVREESGLDLAECEDYERNTESGLPAVVTKTAQVVSGLKIGDSCCESVKRSWTG